MKQTFLFILVSLAIFALKCEGGKLQKSEEVQSDIEAKGDASHWCCAGTTPISFVYHTEIASEVHTVAQQVIVGYESCGIFGWSKCTRWGTQYQSVLKYYVNTVQALDYSSCPETQVKCCKDYIFLPAANNCIGLSTLTTDVILALQQLAINQG